MASAPSPDRVRAMAGMLVPVKVRPVFSKLIEHHTGRSQFSFTASTAAFTSAKSVMVSHTTRSAPLAAPCRTCRANSSMASSICRLPPGSSSSPIGPRSSATLHPVPAAARRAMRTAASTTCSTV